MAVHRIVRSRTESANISWTEPTNFTCAHKYIFESIEKPNMTSPQDFIPGEHKIPYIYSLYGGKNVTCNVEVIVRYPSFGFRFPSKWMPRLLKSKVNKNIETSSTTAINETNEFHTMK